MMKVLSCATKARATTSRSSAASSPATTPTTPLYRDFPGVPQAPTPVKRLSKYRIYTAVKAGVWRVVEDGYKVRVRTHIQWGANANHQNSERSKHCFGW